VLLIAAFFFAFASGRFVPGQAVVSQAVEPARRGAYMSLVGCARDLASGITAAIGGKIIAAGPNGTLLHFNLLGWITIGVSVASLWIFRRVRAVG
jgi:DHA1 family inner membrane transport protein